MCFSWHTIVGFNTATVFAFMVTNHTKYIVNGAFGHIMRRLKTNYSVTLQDMMQIIAKRSTKSFCVSPARVIRRPWRLYLGKYFNAPASFAISKYHYFRF